MSFNRFCYIVAKSKKYTYNNSVMTIINLPISVTKRRNLKDIKMNKLFPEYLCVHWLTPSISNNFCVLQKKDVGNFNGLSKKEAALRHFDILKHTHFWGIREIL